MKTQLLSSSGFMLATKLVGAASGYALAWWVTRHEGAAAYGRFELALTVLTILALGSRLGLDGVLVKWMAATKAQGLQQLQSRLVMRAVVVVLAVSLGGVLALNQGLAPRLTSWLGDGGMDVAWPWVAAGIPAMAMWGLTSEALRGLARMKTYALLQPGMVMAVTVLLMVGLGWQVLPSYALSLGVFSLASVALLAAGLSWSASEKPPEDWGWRSMVVTGWPMLMSSAMFLIMSWTDTLLLGHFLEEDQVGIYRVAFRMAAVVTLVQAAVNSYAAPLFAERHALGDNAGLREALRQTTWLNIVFSVPSFLMLVVAPGWWLSWFGDAFLAGGTCLLWLAAGQLVNALCGPVMYLLNMTGHERVAQRIVWTAAGLNLALNLWAIPRFGIEGAAVATALSMALWNAAAAWAVHRRMGLSVLAVLLGGRNRMEP